MKVSFVLRFMDEYSPPAVCTAEVSTIKPAENGLKTTGKNQVRWVRMVTYIHLRHTTHLTAMMCQGSRGQGLLKALAFFQALDVFGSAVWMSVKEGKILTPCNEMLNKRTKLRTCIQKIYIHLYTHIYSSFIYNISGVKMIALMQEIFFFSD